MTSEPQWFSGDPQRWETFYSAWYQITGAEPVLVEQYLRSEKDAIAAAEKALGDAPSQVIALGLSVEASLCTVKRRSRSQTQTFPKDNVTEYLTAKWFGRLTQILKSVYTQEHTEQR
jgi:hypothetical protein